MFVPQIYHTRNIRSIYRQLSILSCAKANEKCYLSGGDELLHMLTKNKTLSVRLKTTQL